MAFNGRIETVSRLRISGWAWDEDERDTPVSIIVTANDDVLARVLANRFRPDLKNAGIGDGRFSFEVWPDDKLLWAKRYVISARRESDGAYLAGSRAVLEAETTFDDDAKEDFARIIGAVETADDLDRRLTFLAEQREILKQRHADLRSGIQAREARRRRRWTEPRPGNAANASEPPLKRRALVIDERMPRTGRDGGSNAILSHMHALQRLGFEVSFLPTDVDPDNAALEDAGIACCSRPWIGSVEELLVREANSFHLVYLHRASMAIRYAALARHHQRKAQLVYSVADLHFLRLARQADIEQRPALMAQSRLSQTAEMMAAWSVDAVITHSSAEGTLLAERMPPAKVHVIPWTVEPAPTTVCFAARSGLAFIGSFASQPNVDAARWLATTVMPDLGRLAPGIVCLLVGSAMPESLRRVEAPNVRAVGEVPTLTTIFDRVRLTVAPLAYGAGIKAKVLDSLAAGIPCVMTPSAAEGLDLPPLLVEQVASDALDLVRKIRRLHDDEALNRACSEAGLAYIASFASEARIDALLRKALGRALTVNL